MTESTGATRTGVDEFVRTWRPDADPWASAVFVHGLAEHSGRHARTAERLASEGIAVRAFDLVGFGKSGGRRGHVDSWTVYLDQIEDNLAVAAADGVPTLLMGQSMGGLLTIEYCLAERPKPAAAVVISPALGGGAAWQKILIPVLAKVVPTASAPNGLKGEQLSRDPAVAEAYFADPLVYTKSTPVLGRELFAAMDRVSNTVAGLTVPTLAIQGGADTIVPATSTLVLEDVDAADRRLYPKLRHEPLNEPEAPEVLDAIVEWIRSTVGAG